MSPGLSDAAAPVATPPGALPGALPDVADLAGLQPIEKIRRRWPTILGGLLTVVMVFGLVHELFDAGLAGLSNVMPHNPLYYVVFLVLYFASPGFDYLIFRKIWNLPLDGIMALLKKRVLNDVVLGYSGEAYFYVWARERMKMVAAPFGAVKDVSILSAMAGNTLTLAMIAVALPLGAGLLTPVQFNTLAVSSGVIVAMSLPFVFFSRRVFSLARPTLWWIFGMHCLRIIVSAVALAISWHLALPDVSIGVWLLLSAGRQLASRLPFVPNKDLVFASAAILIIGQGAALSDLMAFSAALALLINMVLISGIVTAGVVFRRKPW